MKLESYETAAPDQETAYGTEEDGDGEEGGQHSLWSQNWLPCLQSLLLECRVYTKVLR